MPTGSPVGLGSSSAMTRTGCASASWCSGFGSVGAREAPRTPRKSDRRGGAGRRGRRWGGRRGCAGRKPINEFKGASKLLDVPDQRQLAASDPVPDHQPHRDAGAVLGIEATASASGPCGKSKTSQADRDWTRSASAPRSVRRAGRRFAAPSRWRSAAWRSSPRPSERAKGGFMMTTVGRWSGGSRSSISSPS